MSNKYTETHWAIRAAIFVLLGLTAAQSYLLNQNTGHTKANACMVSTLIRSEYGNDQFTADQDYDEWRQGVVDQIKECLEDYE